jgi:hypothetical protein
MAIVAFFLTISSIVGMRGAHLISFSTLLAFFWCIILFIVPFLLALFACFNYNAYTGIWFRHSWDSSNFQLVRSVFCPPDTSRTLCVATPNIVNVSNTVDYTEWCKSTYNQTDCADIRSSSINRAINWGFTIITVNSLVGVCGLLIIGYAIYICHQLLTSSVITQSMLDVINYLLVLPIACCIGLTINFWWITDLQLDGNVFPYIFLTLTIAQVIALPLGIISGKIKSRVLLSM